jgi:hypothetical protein
MIPWPLIRPMAAPIAISILAAGGAWYAHSSGKQSGMQTIQAKWDAEKVRTLEAQGEQILLAQIRETELTAQMDKLKRTHRETQTRIAADHADLVDSLRQRPDRPASAAGLPEGATAGSGPIAWCDGSQLWRDHAAAFAREAARADELRAALGACQASYNALTR